MQPSLYNQYQEYNRFQCHSIRQHKTPIIWGRIFELSPTTINKYIYYIIIIIISSTATKLTIKKREQINELLRFFLLLIIIIKQNQNFQ